VKPQSHHYGDEMRVAIQSAMLVVRVSLEDSLDPS
jgi:hypothetical protein